MPTTPQGKRLLPVFINETIYREIKVYAAETDKTMQELIKPLAIEFEKTILELVSQIRVMKQQAEVKRLKEEEEAKIVAENPLTVSCEPVEPLGIVIEPQTC